MDEGLTPEQVAAALPRLIPRALGYVSAWLCVGAFFGGFLFSLGALAAWMVVKVVLLLFGATL